MQLEYTVSKLHVEFLVRMEYFLSKLIGIAVSGFTVKHWIPIVRYAYTHTHPFDLKVKPYMHFP